MGGEILIIGSLNMDTVIRMKKMPQKGETVMGKSLSYIPGGKGANQACSSGRLGGRVTMLGCVGKDSFGKQQHSKQSIFKQFRRNLKASR